MALLDAGAELLDQCLTQRVVGGDEVLSAPFKPRHPPGDGRPIAFGRVACVTGQDEVPDLVQVAIVPASCHEHERQDMIDCLANANLVEADLTGANLKGADLTLADLSLANLLGRAYPDGTYVFGGDPTADLTRTNLSSTKLTGAACSEGLPIPEGWVRDREGLLTRASEDTQAQ
jgi:uncharacterized protein YjbI with pentapeptide repeats